MRKINKKNIIKCIKLLTTFSCLNFIGDYLFRPFNIDITRNISVAVGFSIGIVFFSGGFKKKEN